MKSLVSLLIYPLLVVGAFVTTASNAAALHYDGEAVDGIGEFSVIISEGPSATAAQYHFSVALALGSYTDLEVAPAAVKGIETGDIVRVTGSWVRTSDTTESIRVASIRRLSGSPQGGSGLEAATTIRTMIAIGVDLSDRSLSCTDQSLKDQLWSGTKNVRGLYETSSFGTASFTSDVDGNGSVDYYRVSIASSIAANCDYNTWMSQANAALAAQGVNLSAWKHRVYFVPDVNCSFAGLGNVGCGFSCFSLNVQCSLADVTAHELGHNIGLNHAGVDSNNDGTTEDQYGDMSSQMGYGGVGWRQFNGPNKVAMSWLPAERTQGVFSDSTVKLFSLDNDPLSASPTPVSSIQVVRIPFPGATPSSNNEYYVSFRSVDPTYSTNLGGYANKVQVHRPNGTGSLLVSNLAAGQSFTDSAGVSVSVSSVSGNTADVAISFSGSLPPTFTPTRTPTPGGTQTAIPTPTRTPTPTPTPTPFAGSPTPTPLPFATSTPTPTAKPTHKGRGRATLNGRRIPGQLASSIEVIAAPLGDTANLTAITVSRTGEFRFSGPAGDYLLRVIAKPTAPRSLRVTSRWTRVHLPRPGTIVLLNFQYSTARMRHRRH